MEHYENVNAKNNEQWFKLDWSFIMKY
jgi:hypothetical protein